MIKTTVEFIAPTQDYAWGAKIPKEQSVSSKTANAQKAHPGTGWAFR